MESTGSAVGAKPQLSKEELARLQNPAISGEEVAADLAASRELDLDLAGLGSLCLVLGPYRNLTTLTATMLAFHPNCQVLNHAGIRIPLDADFVGDPSSARLDDFVRYAVYISEKDGTFGAKGGSIRKSHAFLREPVASLYKERYGDTDRKTDIRSVLWKESMAITRRLRAPGYDLPGLLASAEQVRFLLPVRNPMDTATSNANLGTTGTMGVTDGDLVSALDTVLDTMAWFLHRQAAHRDRFFHFWQNEVDADVLSHLARFLRLPVDEQWVADALACYQLSEGYDHPAALVDHYRSQVDSLFADLPDARARLHAFAA